MRTAGGDEKEETPKKREPTAWNQARSYLDCMMVCWHGINTGFMHPHTST